MPLLYLALRKVETRRPTVTHDDVQAWLDAYVEAWHTYDPAAIAALFTEDATYAYHPWDEGEDLVRGRDAIVADWLGEQDEPGSWKANYQPLVSEGQRAVNTGTTPNTLAAGSTRTSSFFVSAKTDAVLSSLSSS
jgi:hypothetical protein